MQETEIEEDPFVAESEKQEEKIKFPKKKQKTDEELEEKPPKKKVIYFIVY